MTRFRKISKMAVKTFLLLNKASEVSNLTNIDLLIRDLLIFSRLDASFPNKMAEISKIKKSNDWLYWHFLERSCFVLFCFFQNVSAPIDVPTDAVPLARRWQLRCCSSSYTTAPPLLHLSTHATSLKILHWCMYVCVRRWKLSPSDFGFILNNVIK